MADCVRSMYVFLVRAYSGTVNQISLKGALNANSSKTVEATDFKFDKYVSRDSKVKRKSK